MKFEPRCNNLAPAPQARHIEGMTRPKRPRDTNQLAKRIVDLVTGEVDDISPQEKDPSAIERGRKGGKIGGKVRAQLLGPQGRSEAARKAAQARWAR